MSALILTLAVATLALPTASVVWLWLAKNSNKIEWQVKASTAAGIIIFSFVAGPWAFTSYYLRFVFLALFLVSAFLSFRKIKYRPIFVRMNEKGRLNFSMQVLVFVVILIIDVVTIKGYFHKEGATELSFPLRSGTYYVIQGGASPFTNPFHRRNAEEFYALDIVKLNSFGNRAGGLFPSALSKYSITGDTVFSPCAGKVSAAVDGLTDNTPNTPDKQNPAGNHILIDCNGLRVLLAHLHKTSLLVKTGDNVREGQPIAQVGNSGNSLEPHLHIHAIKDGEQATAVPMLFEGKFLSMNSVVIVK